MRIASRVALFVFLGGPVGGLVTIAVISVWAAVQSPNDIGLTLIPALLIYLIVGALVGLFVGIFPSLLTGLSYALLPQVRHWAPIATIGALTSAAEGYILPGILYSSERANPELSISYAATFALAGAVAAFVCHAQHKRSLDD